MINAYSARLVIASVLALAGAALAQPIPAQEARHQAGLWRQAISDITARFERFGEYTRADIQKAGEAFEDVARQWDAMAKSIDAGEERDLNEWRRLEQLISVRATWQERLEARALQAGFAPSEEWLRQRWVPDGAIPARDAFIEARRNASEAWDAVAEALVPGADPQEVQQLRHAALAAQGEVELAETRFNWARSRAAQFSNPDITSPELTERLSQLQQAEQAIVQQRREILELEGKVRELLAQRQAAWDHAASAYVEARRQFFAPPEAPQPAAEVVVPPED
jgi:hypothetical protein